MAVLHRTNGVPYGSDTRAGATYVSVGTGDGSTLTFSVSPYTGCSAVFVDGFPQPASEWSVAGTTLSFVNPPPSTAVVEGILF